MPAPTRRRVEPTTDWDQLQLLIRWPEQLLYEVVRPIVLFGQSVAERALETGRASRTLHRKAERFDIYGMASLFAEFNLPQQDDRRMLPPPLRQLIVDRKTEYPAFTPHELARLCFVASGRRPSSHTVKRILATGPKPTSLSRRYPRYAQMEPFDRRKAIVKLHAEGWTVTSIAGYLETSRPTVYTALQRWAEEDLAGLPDKSRRRKKVGVKTDMQAIEAVHALQQNPELREFRIHARLKQMGIHLSPRTCGRILALNRSLYKLDKPKHAPKEPKAMPFAATGRHEYWTVDVRYLDMHQLGGGMIYCITILENFSRAILASAVSRTQDLTAYLIVLYAAIRQHGIPEALVSDGGGIFKAKDALRIYAALGIRKEQIARRQPWQSYIEPKFDGQCRMADWHFAQAATWEELVHVHDEFVANFNFQVHWAHRDRQDGRHSPAEVLGWVHGMQRDVADLQRVFAASRSLRRIDRLGYVRFKHWRVYAERGLAREQAAIWLHSEMLTVEFNEEPLAQYGVSYQPGQKQLQSVEPQQLFPTHYQSPQPTLWDLGPGEWLQVLRVPPAEPRRRRAAGAEQLQLVE